MTLVKHHKNREYERLFDKTKYNYVKYFKNLPNCSKDK